MKALTNYGLTFPFGRIAITLMILSVVAIYQRSQWVSARPVNPGDKTYYMGANSEDKSREANSGSVDTHYLYLPVTFTAVQDVGNLPGDWPMAGANYERTSWSPEEVSGKLKAEWYKHLDGYISQKVQIIAANDTLFITTSKGLYGLDASTGAVRWVYPTDLPLGHSPTYNNGVLYVGGFDRKIHAIDALTGRGIWTYQAGAGFHTNPLVMEGRVYAGNRDGYFYAIYTEGLNAGQLAWKYKTEGPILFSAAYKDGVLFFASNDMHAYALNAFDGSLKWKSVLLPGHGFHSWWPVVYQNYVVFVGSYNYRYVKPFDNQPHTALERVGVYPPGSVAGDPVGPYGTEPGDWEQGTRTINAFRITDYFEQYPHRRTYFVLDQATGQELTFDYDGDGRMEFAPVLWFGTHSGTRYPPAVGHDGVIYQSNNYIYNDWIPRGQVSGWKIGTPFISVPNSGTNAVDEPMAYSIGGNVVYFKLCCDREAGAFQLAGSGNWLYYDQGGNMLRRTLPDLFSQGWEYAYWKHGDQSPPIPYKGRVYMINNNAVIAFSPSGNDPVIPPGEERGFDTGEIASNVERNLVVTGLNTKLTIDSATWPLLIQQERYFETNISQNARARYFRLFEVVGSETSNPSSLNVQYKGITTELSSTFGGNQTLNMRVSNRTPSILFETTSSLYFLRGNLAAVAYPTSNGVTVVQDTANINGSELNESWLLVWDNTGNHRWSPVVLSLQNRPAQIELTQNGLRLSYSSSAGYLGVTPLYGMSNPVSVEEVTWLSGIPEETLTRIRTINRLARAFPNEVAESWNIENASGDAMFSYAYQFIQFQDDWNTSPLRIAYLPTHMALAAWNGSPIRVNDYLYEQHLDLNYVTPIGRIGGVPDANEVNVVLPGIAHYWRVTQTVPTPLSPSDPYIGLLTEEIQEMIAAGHLRPGYGLTGVWETVARGGIGDNAIDYWHNPAETIYTLIRALPFIPEDIKPQVRQYLLSEFQAYPPYETSHVGWRNGASREAFNIPPEVEAESLNFPACFQYCNNGWGLPQENIYAVWMYANEFGGASTLFEHVRGKLDTTPDFNQSISYFLNSYIAGYIGYLKLAALANEGPQIEVEKSLIDLLILRAAMTKYPSALESVGFEYGGYKWTLRVYAPNQPDTLFVVRIVGTLWSQSPLYGYPIDLLYGLSGPGQGGAYTFGIDFVNLVPELANFMHDYVFEETQEAIGDYSNRAPYWFVVKTEEHGGEGVFQPLYDAIALFQAKAQILRESRAELEKYVDVPAVRVGDLFYIQKLIAVLGAD